MLFDFFNFPMKYLKRVSYVKLQNGYQTYLFTVDLQPVRYKLFPTDEELNEAIYQAKAKGWVVINATNLTKRLRQQTRNR